MDTVVVVSRTPISLTEVKKQLSCLWSLQPRGGNGWVVDGDDGGRVFIYHPKSKTGGTANEKQYLDYNSQALVKKVILLIADNPEVIVQNEFGTALFGDLFVARIKAEPGWDWRDDLD